VVQIEVAYCYRYLTKCDLCVLVTRINYPKAAEPILVVSRISRPGKHFLNSVPDPPITSNLREHDCRSLSIRILHYTQRMSVGQYGSNRTTVAPKF